MKISIIKYFMTVILSLMIFLVPTTVYANTNCNGISPNTKVYWDKSELKKGQIGRVSIKSKTTLYKLEDNTYTFIRKLNKGERYRVYSYRSGYYGVGGGLFIKRDATALYQTPSKHKLQLVKCTNTSINNSITLFNTKSSITNKLGHPKNNFLNEYTSTTSVYHKNYKNLNMISYINNEAHLIYSKDLFFNYKNLKIGDSVNKVISQLGNNYSTMGNTYKEEVLVYAYKDHEVYIFIDFHKDKKISSFYLISTVMSNKNPTLFPKKSIELQKSYESQMFIVTNSERMLNNIHTLSYSDAASLVARSHSKDMSLNNYFNHTNLHGLSPFDRLTNAGITYRTAGENIAVGYSNPFFAHEALMNSIGHRKNKLSSNYTSLGTGVDFHVWGQGSTPYYAENYFMP